jgi:hypothetical protein
MGGFITEGQKISRAQYMYLFYSQTSTLYDLIPDAPHPSMNPTPTPLVFSHAVDGMIGTFHVEAQSKQENHSNPKSTTPNVQNTPPPPPSLSKASEVNLVQSTPTGKNKNKNKGKGKNKEDKNNNQQSKKPKN